MSEDVIAIEAPKKIKKAPVKVIGKFNYPTKRPPLIETNQRLWFLMLNNKYNSIIYPIQCKDYIQDMYFVEKNQINTFTQFGFTWKYNNKYKLTLKERCKLGLACKHYYKNGDKFEYDSMNNTSLGSIQSAVTTERLLNELEDKLNLPLTKVEYHKDANIMVFDYSNKWADKTYLLSLYTCLLRTLTPLEGEPKNLLYCLNNIKKYNKSITQSEQMLVKTYIDIINWIYNNIDNLPDNSFEKYYNKETNNFSTYEVHNNSGIIYFYNNIFKKQIKC